MKAKDYLKEISRYDSMIQRKLSEVQQLRYLAVSVSAPIGNDVVSTSKGSDRIGNIIAKIVDLENEINAEIDRFVDMKRERIALIEQIPNKLQYIIIYDHYIQYKSLVEIAEAENYTYQYIIETHGEALKTMQTLINNLSKPIETYV